MANTKSAIKHQEINHQNRKRNLARRAQVKFQLKNIERQIKAGVDPKTLQTELNSLYKMLDRCPSQAVNVHKASRIKARAAHMIKLYAQSLPS